MNKAFWDQELETSESPTRRELIVGVPYNFYPYLKPTSYETEFRGAKIIITRSGVFRKV